MMDDLDFWIDVVLALGIASLLAAMYILLAGGGI